MAHQGGKIKEYDQRIKMYKWLEKLEFDLLELPQPDISIFLHMPYEQAVKLKQNRTEIDQHEMDENHLRMAETSYIELSNLYNWYTIECNNEDIIKTKSEIHNEIYNYVKVKVK